jgi:hypothetical protein
MKRLLLAAVLAVGGLAAFLLVGTARSRAERRAIAYAAGLNFTAPSAACTTEDPLRPGYLLCYVEEHGVGEPRGASIFCSTGRLSGGCQKMPTNGEPLLPSNDG